MERDTFMRRAIALAEQNVASSGGGPFGAAIVHDGRIIGEGTNQVTGTHDPTAHAEILAIGQAAEAMGDWRLEGCTLSCTLEPCPMCAGAILQARIERVVFGAADSRWGAVETKLRVLEPGLFNHDVSYVGGVLSQESADLLRSFFRECRQAADSDEDES